MAAISINGILLSLDIEVDDEELMEKITELQEAIEDLDDGAGELKDGASKMQDIVEKDLKTGTEDMKDGTAEMRDETSGMDTEISDKIDELIESVTGSDAETVSFVSEKNTDIESVQFVLTTEAITIPDEEEVEETEAEKPGFWEKLVSLFK